MTTPRTDPSPASETSEAKCPGSSEWHASETNQCEQVSQATPRPLPTASLEANTRPPPPPSATLATSARCSASPEVMFHTVPPCRQRIYQSQSYIRYIESLRVGRRSMCDWDRELSPTSGLVLGGGGGTPGDLLAAGSQPAAASRIPPTPWLERGSPGENNNSNEVNNTDVETLFALRDFMLQEALNVVKFA